MFEKKKSDICLQWQWPDQREPERMITVEVKSIKQDSAGCFGIKHSPSVLGWIPDGVVLSGDIINTDANLSGKTLCVLVPREQIHTVKKGDTLVLGVINPDICITVIKPKSTA